MKIYKNLHFLPETNKKYIFILDTKKDSKEYLDNSYEEIFNTRSKTKKNKTRVVKNIIQKNKNKNKNKNKIKIITNNKKFKILRNFSSNFKEGFLYLESPNKSIFAKRILSEIIPENKGKNNKKYINRKKIYENEQDLVILNTPKTNDSFFNNKYFSNEPKSVKIHTNNNTFQKRYSHNINTNFLNFSNFKKARSSKELLYKDIQSILELNNNNFFIENVNNSCIIEEDKSNIDIDELNDNIDDLSQKEKIRKKSTQLKLNLRKVPFIPPKKLNLKNIKMKKEEETKSKSLNNVRNKINKIPKPPEGQKLYLKKCNLKRHFCHDKFVSNFLTPINQFIKNDFQITNNEYENINKKIHKLNYLINNNDYTIYRNKKKKAKFKDFSPPKIPNIYDKIEKKYFTTINELKNYKFKI